MIGSQSDDTTLTKMTLHQGGSAPSSQPSFRNFVCVALTSSLLVAQVCECIKITKLSVPSVVNEKGDVTLFCDYALEGSILYSAKWYRNGNEFYRYVPLDDPQTQGFDTAGVNVDLKRSNKGVVTLTQVDLDDTGVYKCEVSGESPYFMTDEAEMFMSVIALPDDNPTITGGEDAYHVGNMVRVNCTSPKSKPALSLTWFINGIQAPESYTKTYRREVDSSGKHSRTSSLRFVADDSKFENGRMVLKCTAMVEDDEANEEALYLTGSRDNGSGKEARMVSSYRKSVDVVFSRVNVEVSGMSSTGKSDKCGGSHRIFIFACVLLTNYLAQTINLAVNANVRR